MARIYLSSTFEDLQGCRAEAYRTMRKLGHDVVSMEDYVASGQRPLAQCLADVAACDACVGIVAWRLGFVPAGQTQSITELEMLEAERRGLPCLVFLLADDAPWPPAMVDDDRRPVLALRKRLRERFTVATFHGADELGGAVATAVARLFQHRADDGDDALPEEIDLYRNCVGRFAGELERDIRFYRLATAALVAATLAALALALAATPESTRWLVGAGALVFASTSPLPAVTMRAVRKKKALLDGYADELRKERPARAAVQAVRRFVEGQLQQAGARAT
ncbi:MAG: DUF4062 domain-containing protein [Burkholderiales bacterium]|nr:DUF4062 domain-containing protein [Burkholderiales bacterium]